MTDKPQLVPPAKSPVEIIGDQMFVLYPELHFTIEESRQAALAVMKVMSKNGWAIHPPTAADVDPSRFQCPFCNHERPRMAFSFQAADIGGLTAPGHVEYFVVSCFECKRILAPALLSFVPPQMPAGSSMRI